MPDVIMKLSAEEGAMVRSLLNVVEAQKQGEKGMREWKQSGDAVSQMMKGLEDGATKLGKSVVDGILPGLTKVKDVSSGVAFALETAFSAVEKQIEKVHQRAEKFHKELEDLISAAARAGKISLLPELEKQVDEIKSKKVSNEEKRGLLGGAMMDMPRLSGKQTVDAVEFGVRAKEGGLDGGTAAQVRGTLSEIFPGATKEQLDKNAGKLSGERIAGDEIKALRRAAGGGKSIDDAAADVFGLRVSGESAKSSVAAVEQLTGLDPAEIKAKKMIKDPESQSMIEDLKGRKEQLDAELQALQIKKENLNKDDLSGLEKHTRKAAETERHAENKKIELRESEIRREMHGHEGNISKLGDMEIEDPDAQRRREKLLYINDSSLSPDQQFARAMQTVKENQWMVKPGQQRALTSFGEARKGFGAAPDLVAQARQQLGAIEANSALPYGKSAELKRIETESANFEDGKTRQNMNLIQEADAQTVEMNARKDGLGSAGATTIGGARRVQNYIGGAALNVAGRILPFFHEKANGAEPTEPALKMQPPKLDRAPAAPLDQHDFSGGISAHGVGEAKKEFDRFLGDFAKKQTDALDKIEENTAKKGNRIARNGGSE